MQKAMFQGNINWIVDGVKISKHQTSENLHKVFAKIADWKLKPPNNFAISIRWLVSFEKSGFVHSRRQSPEEEIRKPLRFDLVNNGMEEAFDWNCVAQRAVGGESKSVSKSFGHSVERANPALLSITRFDSKAKLETNFAI